MPVTRSLIAAVAALSGVTGVAVASVRGDRPADDPERPTGTIAVRAVPAHEGAGPARIVVTRQPGAPARFHWATRPGTATAGEDFEAGGGVVQFRAGERARTIEIPISADEQREGAETFDVRLEMLPGLTGPAAPVGTTVIIRD